MHSKKSLLNLPTILSQYSVSLLLCSHHFLSIFILQDVIRQSVQEKMERQKELEEKAKEKKELGKKTTLDRFKK